MSFLSDRFIIFSHEGKNYACFSNILLPLNIAQSVVLWVWTGYQAYSHALKEERVLKEIMELNPGNAEINDPGSKISTHLVSKLQEIMKTWTPDRFEDVLYHGHGMPAIDVG